VLFDFGHTLFAHAPLSVTIAECATGLGAPMGNQQAAAMARRIETAAMEPSELAHPRDLDAAVWRQRWAILYGIADEWVAGLGDAVNADMHDPVAWVPYSRSAATLRTLESHGMAIGIVSNTGWDVRTVFSAHSMTAPITSFTLSCEVGVVKPDLEIFSVACESLGLSPEDVLMVGDDPRADSGAVVAGIRTLLLPPLPAHADNGIAAVIDLVGIRD
jgi:putative hydrolase of the HAD superfamily